MGMAICPRKLINIYSNVYICVRMGVWLPGAKFHAKHSSLRDAYTKIVYGEKYATSGPRISSRA